MNDRIIEMAIEAGFNPVNCTGSNVPLFEKFAELIVRECAKYINERSQDWDADLRWIFNDGSGDMAVNVDELLNRHFGVEE